MPEVTEIWAPEPRAMRMVLDDPVVFFFLTFDSLLLRTRWKHFQWLATLLHCAQENETKERLAIERKDEWTAVQNKNGKYFIYGQCFARKFFQTISSLFVHAKKEVWGKSRSFPLKGFFLLKLLSEEF